MTLFGLVRNGSIITMTEAETAPEISITKGVWLPITDVPVDEDDGLDPAFWNVSGPEIVITETTITRSWTASYRNLEEVQQDLIGKVTLYRQQYMTSGIVWDTFPIDTTPEIIILLIGAAVGGILALQNGQDYSIPWKLSDGSFVTLNATTLFAMFVAVSMFLAGCYNNEGLLVSQIKALTDVPSCISFDITQGWPSNTTEDGAEAAIPHTDSNGMSIASIKG